MTNRIHAAFYSKLFFARSEFRNYLQKTLTLFLLSFHALIILRKRSPISMSEHNVANDSKKLEFTSEIVTDHRSVVWTIQNFPFCPTDVDEYLQSPEFTTRASSIATWTVRVYPKGQRECNSVGKVGLFLHKVSSDTEAHNVRYRLCFRDVYGRNRYTVRSEQLFKGNGTSWGRASVIDREELLGDNRAELLHGDTLTVCCELTVGCMANDSITNTGKHQTKGANLLIPPAFTCYETLSSQFETLYENQKYSDFTLILGERKFPVHKAILATRSPVFQAMFDSGMLESRESMAQIQDMEVTVLEDLLRYIYTGSISFFTLEKSLGLFSAANRYCLDELKSSCKRFMLDHVSSENVCDIAVVADLYDDEELMKAVKDFFRKNVLKILPSKSWEVVLKENPHTASSLLEVAASSCIKKDLNFN